MGTLNAPQAISDRFDLKTFDCGVEVLNIWLKNQALKNQVTGASRTFVVVSNLRVVGYYALATGSVERELAASPIARNAPNPIPVMVLGRLAVDLTMQGKGVGAGMLKDALFRVYRVSKEVGVKALLVHALSEQAKTFYLQYGFIESPIDKMMLMLPIKSVEQVLNPNPQIKIG